MIPIAAGRVKGTLLAYPPLRAVSGARPLPVGAGPRGCTFMAINHDTIGAARQEGISSRAGPGLIEINQPPRHECYDRTDSSCRGLS